MINKSVKNALWNDIIFPHGKIYEDIAILYKVVLSSELVAVVNKPLYNYFRHKNSIVSSAFKPAIFDYPFNTRNMMKDINSNYPRLYEYACWAHTKGIIKALEKLAKCDTHTYKKYKSEFISLSKELFSLRNVWKKSKLFNSNDRKMCLLFSNHHISRLVWRVHRNLKKIKR